MHVDRVSFATPAGRELSAPLHRPAGTPVASAVFAHGFPAAVDDAVGMAEVLAARGIAVLRLDVAQLGGDAASAVVAGADFLGRELLAPGLVVGHGRGAAAALDAAPRLAALRAVATIAAAADPAQLDAVAGLGRALLVLHAPAGGGDDARLFYAARAPRSFLSLDGDARHAGELIATWALPYLDVGGRLPTGAREGEVVCSTEAGGFRTQIAAGAHLLVADEPADVGGSDAGPSPYGLLAAALGSCTTMTLRLYAERKGWPLERAEVTVRHQRRHAPDCENAERDGRAKLDVFERRLRLIGDLSAEQRARLVEIAEKCPVHKTLSSQVCIETELC